MVFLLFMILTIAAWASKFRSSATRMCVSLFSSFVSLSCTWLILTRYLGCEKDVLRVKVSVGLTSRPLGCLVRGRSLAQARDWRVRFTSGSAEKNVSGMVLMPLEADVYSRRPVSVRMSEYDSSSPSLRRLKSNSTIAWKLETTSSLCVLPNVARIWQ